MDVVVSDFPESGELAPEKESKTFFPRSPGLAFGVAVESSVVAILERKSLGRDVSSQKLVPADEGLSGYSGGGCAGLVGGRRLRSEEGPAAGQNGHADAVVGSFSVKMFFESGEEVKTPLGMGGGGAAEDVKIAFSSAVIATPALRVMTIMVAEEPAACG